MNLKKTLQKKIRILFIEDDFELRKLITENLKYCGFEVVEAVDGIEGHDKALLYFPDLILLDLLLPKVDGLTLCQRLKSDTRTSNIPTLMITALEELKYILKDFGPVADDYIEKPFDLEELIERIKALIKKNIKN